MIQFSKKIRVIALSFAMAILIAGTAVVSYAYDGAADPVISLSYLRLFKQQEIDPQIAQLNETITNLNNQITQLNSQLSTAQSTLKQMQSAVKQLQEQPEPKEQGYEVIEVMFGSKVIAKSPCDIMLSSGTAVAVSQYDSQGLSDYTVGAEVMNGESITINHMMLIPRGDGRGILITSANAFIMIRGEYAIES